MDTTNQSDHIQPLCISDLILITTAFSLVLLINTSLSDFITHHGISEEPFWNFWQFLFCFLTAMGIASAIVLTRQKVATGNFFCHPGHWSLLACSILHVVQFVGFTGLTLAYRSRIFDADSVGVITYSVAMITASIVGAIIVCNGAIRCQAWWRVLSGFVAVCMLFNSFYYGCNLVNFPDSVANIVYFGFLAACLLCVLLVISATLVDARQGIRRGWVHWLGVLILCLTLGFHPLVMGLVL